MAEYINRELVELALVEKGQTSNRYKVGEVWELNGGEIRDVLDSIPNEDVQPVKWILVKSRPMDEEERKEWSEKIGYDIEYEDAVIYTSQLPDDGQEVLTCNRYGTIAIDKFYSDPDLGCYFDENGDMDGIVAWMPLPEPPKDGET